MEISNCYSKNGTGFQVKMKRWLMSLIALFAFVAVGFSQEYPFPQNYQYPNGEIYTGSSVETTLQGLYETWKSTYYVEGTINSTECARIKFVQSGEDGTNSVSEGIAYGMLIFVYMDNSSNDTQDEFDKLWAYYQANSNSNGVMNWKVNAFTGNVTSGDGNANGATDAELDAAQALLMAHKQWGSDGDVDYLSAAQTLITTIWNYEINTSEYLLKPGDAFDDYKNPCYFITNAMQLFANVEADQSWTTHSWETVVSNSYSYIKDVANSSTGLVPDWAYADGSYIDGIIDSKFESYFGYDAIRVPWRMAMAYAWYGHSDAYDIASDITSWAQTNYSNPANIVDGYFLDGSVLSGLSGSLSSWGTSNNACFMGGLTIGSMVDDGYSSYMTKSWESGAATDYYGAYYTHTTQLLFMLCLSGNMPNFWDMNPVPTAAETNSDGDEIIITFSKTLESTTSTVGWTVETYEDGDDISPTTISVSSVSISDDEVTLTLSSDISEPYIYVSYNGSSIVSSDDNLEASAFDDYEVENLITNMEPYSTQRYTDIYGTVIYVKWSKEISESSLDASAFTFYIDGVEYDIITDIALNSSDASIIELTIDGGNITSSEQELTLDFDGAGSILGTSGTASANAFDGYTVQNMYMSVDCYTVEDFDGNGTIGLAAAWSGCVDWTTEDDPEDASSSVAYFEGNGTGDGCVRGQYSDATDFIDAITQDDARLKCSIYLANTSTEDIEILFCNYESATSGSYYDSETRTITIDNGDLTQNSWVEIDQTITTPTADHEYDCIMIRGSNAASGSDIAFYIDDLEICPADPVVEFESGHVSYLGDEVEITFSTTMQVPSSTSAITIKVDGTAYTVESIESKTGDATTLVLTLATSIDDENAVVTASGGSSLTAVDGRTCETFTNQPITNLYNITVTTGWRDNFESSTDYITENVGGYEDFTITEDADDGLLSVTFDGSEGFNPLSVMTYSTDANASKEVMDLTDREYVQFQYRINGSVPSNLELRISCKDLVNDYSSDGMSWLTLSPSTSWQEVTIDLSATLYNQYDYSSTVEVDRTNIYQVMFYFVTDEGDSDNSYTPTVFDGIIEFDYIVIGSPLYLYDVTDSVVEDEAVSATSSAAGEIYLVPEGTSPVLSVLQDSVLAGVGVSVDCEAEDPTTLETTGLAAGYYYAYAYDPDAGAISSKVAVEIYDVTAPVITAYSDGEISIEGNAYVTVSEDAKVYMVAADDVTTIEALRTAGTLTETKLRSYSIGSGVITKVAEGVSTGFTVEDATVGTDYVLYAVDYSGNISSSTSTSEPITIVNPDLTMSVSYDANDDEELEQGDDITVTVNRAATAYLVPKSASISSISDIVDNAVASVELTDDDLTGIISTTGIDEGYYYVYVSDGTDYIGPSSKITIVVSYVAVESISTNLATDALSVSYGDTETVEIYFSPTSPTLTDLDLDYDSDYLTVSYDSTTQILSVTGVGVTESTTLTLTSADGPDITITVTVTCPAEVPTATEVPDVTTCSGDPDALEATFSTSDETAVWYASATATTALYTGNTYEHGETTADTYTYYVAKSESGCESSDRLEVSLTINETPDPTITEVGTVCQGDVVTLAADVTGGTWSGTGVSSGGIFTSTSLSADTYTITYEVTSDGCTGTATLDVTVAETPAEPTLTAATVCEGETGELTATASSIWYDSAKDSLTTGTSYKPTDTEAGSYTYYAAAVNSAGCTSDMTSIIYKIIATPGVPTVAATSYCYGDGDITLTATGLETGATVSWYTSTTATTATATGVTLDISETEAGDYTYYATQTVSSCESEMTSGTATINELPSVSLSGDTEVCSDGGDVSLTVSPTGGTLTGTGIDATALTFSPDEAGDGIWPLVYSYTDDNGCSNADTLSITVHETALPTVSNASPSILVGESIPELSASADGDITWYSDETLTTSVETGSTYTPSSSVVDNAVEGSYTYYVTNTENDCESGSVAVTLTVTECGEDAPTVASAKMCVGDATVPTLTATTGDYITWYDSDGTTKLTEDKTSYTPDNIDNTTDSTYTYYATQTGTCESSQTKVTITVNKLPTVTLSGLPDVCADGAAITLSSYAVPATGGEFTGSGVASGEFTPSESLAGDVAITYSYENSETGCSNTATDTLTVIYLAAPTVDVTPVTTTIDVEPDAFTVSDVETDATVKWYSDAALTTSYLVGTGTSYQAAAESAEGDYTYYVTQTLNSCVSEAATAVVSVSSCEVGVPTVSDTSICVGDEVPDLTAEATESSYTLTWYSSAGVKLETGSSYSTGVSSTSAEEYTYYVSQTGDCEGSKTEVTLTVNELPDVNFTTVSDLCLDGSSIDLDGYVSPEGGEYSGAQTSATFDPTSYSKGDYSMTYTYTDENGCTASADQTISVIDCSVLIKEITIPETATVAVGSSTTIKITFDPTSPSSTALDWSTSSSDGGAVNVSSDGTTATITGVTAGTVTIYAIAQDGSTIESGTCTVTVTDQQVAVESVSFSNDETISIEAGETVDLSEYLVIEPDTATVSSIVWSSLDESVATVDADGVVTGADVSLDDEVTIKVVVTTTDGTSVVATITLNVTVASTLVTEISIPSTLSIEEGGSETISATVSPSNADDNTVTWSISSGTGGTINASTGEITATGSVGDVFYVIATANDASGKVSDPCEVTIVEEIIAVEEISLSVDSDELVIGDDDEESTTLTITVGPEDANQLEFTVSASVSGVVSIVKVNDTTYTITGVEPADNLTITVVSDSDGTVYKTITIDVIQPVTSISITDVDEIAINEEYQLLYDVWPDDATNSSLSWTSSDESVATVDADGVVTGLTEGEVTIIATAADGFEASASVTIDIVPVDVTSISVTSDTYEVEVDDTITVAYSVNPYNATNSSVTFSSADESIATVNEDGVVTGISYDTETGSSTVAITITSDDNTSISNTVYVTVVPVQADKDSLVILLERATEEYTNLGGTQALLDLYVGSGEGQISQSAWDEFEAALYNASGVNLDNSNYIEGTTATQAEVDSAYSRLYDAMIAIGIANPSGTVDIEEVEMLSVSVYPVPFANEITVESNSGIIAVKVISISSEIVQYKSVADELTTVIDASNIDAGIYFIQVITDEGVIVKKAVKK